MRRLLFSFPVALLPFVAWAASPIWGPHCAVPQQDLKAAVTVGAGEPSLPGSFPKPVLPAANQPQHHHAPSDPAVLPIAADPPAVTEAGLPPEAATAVPAVKPANPKASSSSDEAPTGRRLTPPEIAHVPALKRIASAGAVLFDLGEQHGMRTVFARSGPHFQVFYVTPDGRAEIGGIMWDAAGKDLTLDQVRKIPGVVPTVTIGRGRGGGTPRAVTYRQTSAVVGAEPALGLPPKPAPSGDLDPPAPRPAQAATLLAALDASTHGTIGQVGAPQLYMLIDPQCMFSIRAMHALSPYVAAGKVHLTVIPVSVLDYEDQGASTVKAKVMVSQPPQTMVADWIDLGLPEQAAPGASAKLAANMTLARMIQLTGTPTFLWRSRSGGLGRIDGLPPDISAMLAQIAPSS